MFTGIITGVGRIVATNALGSSLHHGKRLCIAPPEGYLQDVGMGDSIALNGACMTVTSLDLAANQFTIDISQESLSKTAGLDAQGMVNLEKALRANDRLGGHIVSGHVDGVGHVSFFAQIGESWELRVMAPLMLAKYLAYKGSITVNGVSLTVNSVKDIAANTIAAPSPPMGTTLASQGAPNTPAGCEISINLIPHTVQNTALGSLKAGSAVNLEIDTVARYVERMLSLENTSKIAR